MPSFENPWRSWEKWEVKAMSIRSDRGRRKAKWRLTLIVRVGKAQVAGEKQKLAIAIVTGQYSQYTRERGSRKVGFPWRDLKKMMGSDFRVGDGCIILNMYESLLLLN
jgi:hypothetical protein